jgi:hypothetical protein
MSVHVHRERLVPAVGPVRRRVRDEKVQSWRGLAVFIVAGPPTPWNEVVGEQTTGLKYIFHDTYVVIEINFASPASVKTSSCACKADLLSRETPAVAVGAIENAALATSRTSYYLC